LSTHTEWILPQHIVVVPTPINPIAAAAAAAAADVADAYSSDDDDAQIPRAS